MYELFEHTADLGLRVETQSEEQLFEEAAEGLFAMIVESLPVLDGAETIDFRVAGRRRDWLLVDWLNELLYVFESGGWLLGDFRVRLGADGLDARAKRIASDGRRDRLLHEVKAVTYHGLRVERSTVGWRAEVIVDI